MNINRGLGKGLSDLLGEEGDVEVLEKEELLQIPIGDIKVGMYQPRKDFSREALYELSESIKKNGLLQPIIVAKSSSGYVIIAGERRWRACQIAGMKAIPVIVKDINDRSMLECALVENIQRENLNIVEEAEGYLRLMGEFGYTQEELSSIIGKSRSHIGNILRLNTLSEKIKKQLLNKNLSMGHARCLVGHEDAEEIADMIIDKGLNVRQTENLVRNWGRPFKESQYDRRSNDSMLEITKKLSNKLGVKVTSEQEGFGGRLILHYNNEEQLDEMLTKMEGR